MTLRGVETPDVGIASFLPPSWGFIHDETGRSIAVHKAFPPLAGVLLGVEARRFVGSFTVPRRDEKDFDDDLSVEEHERKKKVMAGVVYTKINENATRMVVVAVVVVVVVEMLPVLRADVAEVLPVVEEVVVLYSIRARVQSNNTTSTGWFSIAKLPVKSLSCVCRKVFAAAKCIQLVKMCESGVDQSFGEERPVFGWFAVNQTVPDSLVWNQLKR